MPSFKQIQIISAFMLLMTAFTNAYAECGYQNQFTDVADCNRAQVECSESSWRIYVTGCNYYCDGGSGYNRCERPEAMENTSTTPEAFNYGFLSTTGQLLQNTGVGAAEAVVGLGSTVADLVRSGYQCATFGNDSWGQWAMSCAKTAVVGGGIVLSVYFPAAAPYVLKGGVIIGDGIAGYNALRCTIETVSGKPLPATMAQAIHGACTEAVVAGATTWFGLRQLKLMEAAKLTVTTEAGEVIASADIAAEVTTAEMYVPGAIAENDIIVDTNFMIGLRKFIDGEVINDTERAVIQFMAAVHRHVRWRAMPAALNEVPEIEAAIFRPGLVSIENDAPAFLETIEILIKNSVGGGRVKGYVDQRIVTQTAFAVTNPGVTPTLASSDNGIIKGMARLAGINIDEIPAVFKVYIEPAGRLINFIAIKHKVSPE